MNDKKSLTRRQLLAGLAAGGASLAIGKSSPASPAPPDTEPFWGAHQGGIATPQQKHTYFAAFDLSAEKRDEVVTLLRDWTAAAARLTQGQLARPLGQSFDEPPADGGGALGLSPGRLTITFGFGPGLFEHNGEDRYGLKSRRPEALVDLPRFSGDQLVEAHTGGDLSVQACADDPQVAFHAVRELVRIAYGAVEVRWAQTGFVSNHSPRETPRNLMGFKDGTSNPSPSKPREMDKFVWVGGDGPAWMRGGSYLVVRRIRIALEHWDRMTLGFQEQTIGRHKYSGAPIGGKAEFEPVNLDATDKDGNALIAENSHVRLSIAASNDGARILRRAYSYNDGVSFTAERWPPWRQGMEYDAGLLFMAYQSDPRTGFIKIFDKMSKLDQMNQFVTHVGSGIFACPGGVVMGEFVGQGLFG
ncbi:MAG: iron uptake transporter deferrochelatase/peroxidase subunit [Capsulimonadaceae bacterium]|nr:iron uptake transporter deferrochelatase/peroxidase subunit [Capsulimonadaceae bacterium]